jgi:hypothetical protein
MSKIAIVGAGRVGTAVGKLLLQLSDHEILLIDNDQTQLEKAHAALSEIKRSDVKVMMQPDIPCELFLVNDTDSKLIEILVTEKPDVVVNAVPHKQMLDVVIATYGADCHYVDFHEMPMLHSENFNYLNPKKVFMTQTGLAPGLMNYVGRSLFEELGKPHSISMRVGNLPQVTFGQGYYAITSNTEDQLRSLTSTGMNKSEGEFNWTEPLGNYQNPVFVNGAQYEDFDVAFLIGDMNAWHDVPNVEAKALRYPGTLADLSMRFRGKTEAERLGVLNSFRKTFDDVVVLSAIAIDEDGNSACAGLNFYPYNDMKMSAIEVIAGGCACAMIELILAEKLNPGYHHAGSIEFNLFMSTAGANFVFDCMN